MKQWIDFNFRGMGQVMLQNNPYSGLLFLGGISWSAYAMAEIQIAVAAVYALLIANLTAIILKADQENLHRGLYGYNAVLIGIAVLVFFKSTPLVWGLLTLGAALSAVFMWWVLEKSKPSLRFPILTFPFVVITWLMFMVLKMIPALAKAVTLDSLAAKVGSDFYLNAILKSVSQVFLLQNSLTGSIFLVALACGLVASASFAILGAVLALVIAVFLSADLVNIEAGLWGYNAVLTAIALGCVFVKPSFASLVYVVLGVVAAIIIQYGLGSLLAGMGLPVFTAPFVFATWLVLGIKKLMSLKMTRQSI